MNPILSFATVPRAGLIAALCLVGAVHAQAQAQTAAMPAMKGEGAARWVCGGIGSDESNAMRAAMKSHPLSLLFARKDGAYLADVQVVIQAAGSAPALTLRADGPVCLIDLPAGRYEVKATADGVVLNESVNVGNAPQNVNFRF